MMYASSHGPLFSGSAASLSIRHRSASMMVGCAALAPGARDRHEVVVQDENAQVGRVRELLADPSV
ncbi:MAG: hypothetical protein ACTS6J_03180, partial [Burkholderiales bacterium]